MASPDSTTEGITARSNSWLSRLASRAVMVFLLAACIAASVGLLGGRTDTATASAAGYRMVLSYPGTSRPGLDTYWQLSVQHPGGFHRPITIAVTATYFDLFETQGFYPTPSDTSRDDSFVYLTFSPPAHGTTFRVLYDAYLQPYIAPSRLLANDATVAVVSHGERVAAVHYSTWVLP